MADPREQAIRSALTIRMEKMLKRRRYDERQVIQILRCTPDKAQLILKAQLDGFGVPEIQRFLDALD